LNARENLKPEKHVVFLLLGSNIKPKRNLTAAIKLLQGNVEVIQISSVWESPADGTVGPDFLNAVAKIHTSLTPTKLKDEVLRKVETQLGRIRSEDKFAPRTIDLDILVYDGEVIDPILWLRGYVAAPLAELLPDLRNKTTGEILKNASHRLQADSNARIRKDIQLLTPSIL